MEVIGALIFCLGVCALPFVGMYSMYKAIKTLIRLKNGDACTRVMGKVYRVTSAIHDPSLHAKITYTYNGKSFTTSTSTKPASKGGLKVGDQYEVEIFASDGSLYQYKSDAIIGIVLSALMIVCGIIGIIWILLLII